GGDEPRRAGAIRRARRELLLDALPYRRRGQAAAARPVGAVARPGRWLGRSRRRISQRELHMKSKLTLVVTAAAVASALAAPARALTVPGRNGSLFLAVWDVSGRSYVRDLGLTLNDFLPTGTTIAAADGGGVGDKTPAAGLHLTFAADPLFQSNFAG